MRVQANLILLASTHVSSWFSLLIIRVTDVTYLQVVLSWGNDKCNRVIGVSPRNRNIGRAAPEAHPHQDRSHGVGSDQYFLLTFDCSSPHGPWPRGLPTYPSPSEVWGQQSLGVHWSPCSPSLSSSMIMSELHCRRPSLTMEASLMLSNAITPPVVGEMNPAGGCLP